MSATAFHTRTDRSASSSTLRFAKRCASAKSPTIAGLLMAPTSYFASLATTAFRQASLKSSTRSLQLSRPLSARKFPTHIGSSILVDEKAVRPYSTASGERGEDPHANHFHTPKSIVYIFILSSTAVYGSLAYLSGRQSNIRKNLQGGTSDSFMLRPS